MALAWSARGIRLRDFLQKVPAPGPNTQGSGGGQKGLANKRPNPRDGGGVRLWGLRVKGFRVFWGVFGFLKG